MPRAPRKNDKEEDGQYGHPTNGQAQSEVTSNSKRGASRGRGRGRGRGGINGKGATYSTKKATKPYSTSPTFRVNISRSVNSSPRSTPPPSQPQANSPRPYNHAPGFIPISPNPYTDTSSNNKQTHGRTRSGALPPSPLLMPNTSASHMYQSQHQNRPISPSHHSTRSITSIMMNTMSINSPIAHVASLSRSVTPDSLNSDGENSDNNSSMTNSPTLSHSSGFSLNSPLRSPLGQSSSHKENGNGSLGSPLGKNKRSRKSQNHVLERRRERNREAAKRSRHRQQKRAEELERRCNILKNTEIEMNRKLNLLKRFNDYPPDKVVCLEGRKRNLVEIDECVDYLMYQLTYLDLQIQYLITNVVTFNQERIECTTMYDRGEDVTFPTVVGYLSPDPSCGLKPHELFALQQKQKEAANGSNDLSSQNIPPHNSDGTDKNSALSTKSASPTATTKS